jgi:DNA-directed RNA polymerase subunit RPC12/RpoP
MRSQRPRTNPVPDRYAIFSQAPQLLASAIVEGVDYLSKCLKCAAEVVTPVKEWDIKPKNGRGAALHIRLFQCPNCGHKFRVALKAN